MFAWGNRPGRDHGRPSRPSLPLYCFGMANRLANVTDGSHAGRIPAASRHDRWGLQGVRLWEGGVYRWDFSLLRRQSPDAQNSTVRTHEEFWFWCYAAQWNELFSTLPFLAFSLFCLVFFRKSLSFFFLLLLNLGRYVENSASEWRYFRSSLEVCTSKQTTTVAPVDRCKLANGDLATVVQVSPYTVRLASLCSEALFPGNVKETLFTCFNEWSWFAVYRKHLRHGTRLHVFQTCRRCICRCTWSLRRRQQHTFSSRVRSRTVSSNNRTGPEFSPNSLVLRRDPTPRTPPPLCILLASVWNKFRNGFWLDKEYLRSSSFVPCMHAGRNCSCWHVVQVHSPSRCLRKPLCNGCADELWIMGITTYVLFGHQVVRCH